GGYQQGRRGQQQDEQPVRERTGEQGAADVGVAFDYCETEVDRRVVGAGGVDVLAQDRGPLQPAREPAGCAGLDVDAPFGHLSPRPRSRRGAGPARPPAPGPQAPPPPPTPEP